MHDLSGKSVIVTGGASGIGRATVMLATRAGARVIVADLNERLGHETTQEAMASGGEAFFVRTDVTDENQVRALVDVAVSRYGRLDGAFNNAGISPVAVPTAEITADQFRHMLAVNLTGVFLCMKYAITAMLPTGGGSIVNTSSSAAATALPNMCDYLAAKYGVVGITKGGAIDYAAKGIRVNAILPGAVRTPMLEGGIAGTPGMEEYLLSRQPIGRLGRPEEIAAAAVFLLSDAASLITGVSLPVDGGYTV